MYAQGIRLASSSIYIFIRLCLKVFLMQFASADETVRLGNEDLRGVTHLERAQAPAQRSLLTNDAANLLRALCLLERQRPVRHQLAVRSGEDQAADDRLLQSCGCCINRIGAANCFGLQISLVLEGYFDVSLFLPVIYCTIPFAAVKGYGAEWQAAIIISCPSSMGRLETILLLFVTYYKLSPYFSHLFLNYELVFC